MFLISSFGGGGVRLVGFKKRGERRAYSEEEGVFAYSLDWFDAFFGRKG